MTSSRCSAEHIREYRNAINAYLVGKAITDFSKYDISFKKDKLSFNKWDYPSIPQPVNINPIPTVKENYIPPKIYPFIVNVGRTPSNHYNAHLFTIHMLDIPGMTENSENNCIIQLTPCLNTLHDHDEIFMNIRHYTCLKNKLRLELTTVRSTKETWSLNITAHVTVFYKPVKIYYSYAVSQERTDH